MKNRLDGGQALVEAFRKLGVRRRYWGLPVEIGVRPVRPRSAREQEVVELNSEVPVAG